MNFQQFRLYGPLAIAGGAIAGFGGAFLIETLEKIAFPGVTG